MGALIVFIALIFIGAFWALPTIVASSLGGRKGRTNAWLWGFILSWLGVIILVCSPDTKSFSAVPYTPAYTAAASLTKDCPDCAEAVGKTFAVCNFCGHRF